MRTTLGVMALAIASFCSACGGGDPPDVQTSSRTCSGPFEGTIVAQCDVEVRSIDSEMIVLRAEALMHAHNGTRDPLCFQRFSMVRFGGDAYGYVTDEFVLQPGESRSVEIAVSAEVPVANADRLPTSVNFSSYDYSGGSYVTDLRVTATPKE